MWLTLLSVAFLCLGGQVASSQVFGPDPIQGYALGGHDPVAYFVDHKPRKGSGKFVYKWGGARWVFVNEGNLAAFKKNPKTYAPLYAACGAYALAEGFATEGNPFLFAIVDGKLVFFHTPDSRFLFLVNAKQLMSDAAANAQKTGCVPQL